MKMNSTTIGWLIGTFIWSIFMGVTAISIGFGAIFPPLNYIAKPLACPNGDLSVEQDISNPMPGTTTTTATWFCKNPGADKPTPIDPLKMGLYAGPFYGVLLFALGFSFWYMNTRWGADTVIGKILRQVQMGMVILVVAFLVIFPMWPLIKEFLPTVTPTPAPTVIPTTVTPVSIPTLLQPTISTPTIGSNN